MSATSSRAWVFVYGTLRPGGSRWPSLSPYAEAVEPAVATGDVYDSGHGYPAARFGGSDAGEVRGWRVLLREGGAAEAIALLDEIEGEGVLFDRVVVATSAGDAFAYQWRGTVAGLRRLPEGWPAD